MNHLAQAIDNLTDINKTITCPSCDGKGGDCWFCQGQGQLAIEDLYEDTAELALEKGYIDEDEYEEWVRCFTEETADTKVEF